MYVLFSVPVCAHINICMIVCMCKHTHDTKSRVATTGLAATKACMTARRASEAGWLRYAGTPPHLCMTTYLAVRGGLELAAVGY